MGGVLGSPNSLCWISSRAFGVPDNCFFVFLHVVSGLPEWSVQIVLTRLTRAPQIVKLRWAKAARFKNGHAHFVMGADFYTPPVLGGVALFDNSAPAVYKNPVP